MRTDAEINARTPVMQRRFQSREKRTIRRRLVRVREEAPERGMTPWITTGEETRPQRICSVGRARLPSTTHAIERFFRAFQRCYATQGGVHSVLRATREWRRLFVVAGFTPPATTGHAPIDVLVPEARRMPLYRLIHDPFRAVQERESVKPEAHMADVLRPKAAPA